LHCRKPVLLKDELKCIRKENLSVDPDRCIKLLVLTVVTNVKYHLDQLKNAQSTVENAFQSTDRQESVQKEEDVDSEADVIPEDLEKCTSQFAVTVVKLVKCLLNLHRENQSIAATVGKNIHLPDDTNKKIINNYFCKPSILDY
jgi:phage-related minor tail protein